ncbi:hypothetical protein CBR_g10831 [Chara braunii]|uniref:Uncharacterized protein n=1 Tax=Chara braunii TaxID=69332 RepID=A0A388KPD1_CHABU|nr:hypothetical protein CBR_g10831 [Chara braunii]|eukprot:GBG71895.1 hypothetical protein CBR_g10831 [Chara braunii]
MKRKKRKEVSAIQGADLAVRGVLSNMAAHLKEMKEQMVPGKEMAVGQATNKRRYGEDDEGDKEEEEEEIEESEQTTKAKVAQKKTKNKPTGEQGTSKGQNPQQAGTSEAQAPAAQLAPWPVVAPMGAAITRKVGVAGPSRPASGRERRQGLRRVTIDADGMPIYKKGDNLRLFLKEFEDHAFRREWDTPTMLSKVNGVGECQLKIEEITTDCLGWMTFKTEMWAEYGDLRRDGIENDIIFDGTNVKNFEDNIALCAEKKGWKEEEKLEQLLHEQELWIGRRGDKMEKKTRQEIDEDDVPLRQVFVRKRTTFQKGGGSANRTAGMQEKRIGREKKQSKEEEEREREQDMMREEWNKEVEEVAREKESTKEKKEREEEGEKESDMMSGKKWIKEVEEIAKEKEGAKENKGEEKERNLTEKGTGMAVAENPLREPGSRRMTKDERENREEENKEWGDKMVASMKEDELPADAPWSEKIERILLIESIRGSKLRSDLNKLIRLHELLRDDCEWFLEGGVEVAEKLEGAGRSQRGNDEDEKVKASIRELQEMVKEKKELLTQGVASHIPENLREIQRLRKREESRDAQVEKMGKEEESMTVEMSKVKEEQQKFKKQVESLNIALDSKNKEVEKKKVEREKLEKEVGKLEGKVNKQEKEMETLRKVS